MSLYNQNETMLVLICSGKVYVLYECFKFYIACNFYKNINLTLIHVDNVMCYLKWLLIIGCFFFNLLLPYFLQASLVTVIHLVNAVVDSVGKEGI